ncbi:hypothetical protein D3C78_866640 [compost metagenome]
MNQTLVQRVRYIINIIGRAAHQLAVIPAGEEWDGQLMKMNEQLPPHLPYRALRYFGEQHSLQPADQTAPYIYTEHNQA